MKKANELLNEIKTVMERPESIDRAFQSSNHPAYGLDEYMKEQYIIALFSTLLCSESDEKKAISYLVGVAKQADFKLNPENIVKSVFAFDEKQLQDCAVSFRDEEIKYLLGFELYVAVQLQVNSENTGTFLQKIYQAIELSQSEQESFSMIYLVLKNNDLSRYTKKENYSHSHILQCYLHQFDFENERTLVISNCLKEVRSASCDKSIDYIATVPFVEAHFISDYRPGEYRYVEKGTPLGHFIAMIGGFSLGVGGLAIRAGNNPDFIRKWDQMDEDEKRLITPKFKDYNSMHTVVCRDYFEDNTYEVCDILAEKSGVFYFIYNGIGEYNDPFAVISHPLDDEEEIEKYLDDKIDLSRSLIGNGGNS